MGLRKILTDKEPALHKVSPGLFRRLFHRRDRLGHR